MQNKPKQPETERQASHVNRDAIKNAIVHPEGKIRFADVMWKLRRVLSIIPDVVANKPVLYFLAGLILVGCVYLVLLRHHAVRTDDLLVEVFGFLLDIMLFGVLLSLYDSWRERRMKIRHYHDELADFLSWGGREGVLRKVGITRRLNKMQAPLPDMSSIVLIRANLDKENLRGANLSEGNVAAASLRSAKLEGADLGKANLRGTNLVGANLERARTLRCRFRRSQA